MSKTLSKYIVSFDYFEKTLIVLSATSGGISIISFTSVVGVPVRIASASFKHNRIVMLAKRKLNSVETLISQALIDLKISHEEFKTIVNEEENYRRLKEDIRMIKSSDALNKKENKKIETTKL